MWTSRFQKLLTSLPKPATTCHRCVKTGYPKVDQTIEKVTRGRADQWLKMWEDLTGLTPVKEAQAAVIEANNMLREARNELRVLQQQRSGIQKRLKDVARKIEKQQRGTTVYAELINEETKIFQEDNSIVENINNAEERERLSFESLTHSIYLAHEKENEQREHTKYISIIATLVGTIIGGVVAYGRIRSVDKAVSTSEESLQQCKVMLTDLQSQQHRMHSFIADIKHQLNLKPVDVQSDSESSPEKEVKIVDIMCNETETSDAKELLVQVKKQGQALEKDMKEIQKVLGVKNSNDGNVVYVGPEIKELLEESEKNMEWKLKIHALASVTFIYGAVALTLPVVLSFFKSS